jgi:uncharacterized protein YidB (DUF937 family)
MDKLLGGGSGGLGGLESILGGGVSSLLPAVIEMMGGKGGAGSGLEKLVSALQAGGLGDIVGSWIGTGPNKKITKAQVKKHVDPHTIKQLASQSGLPADAVVQHLTTLLPSLVNNLTPEGRLPDATALNKSLQGLQGLLKG